MKDVPAIAEPLLPEDRFSRRQLGLFVALLSLFVAAGHLGSWLWRRRLPAGARSLGPMAGLERGSYRVVQYPDPETRALLIRRENGAVVAFAQRCPHLGCPVAYQPPRRREGEGKPDLPEGLVCACHQGRFDLDTGRGTAGPPLYYPPLARIQLQISNGEVFGLGLEGDGGESRTPASSGNGP